MKAEQAMAEKLDIANFRAKLEERLIEIKHLQDISAESRSTVELDQSSVGRLSRMDAMQNQQIALASERKRQDELLRIEAALQRIEEGTYGECLVCGEQIAAKRLGFDPSITTCITCATGKTQ